MTCGRSPARRNRSPAFRPRIVRRFATIDAACHYHALQIHDFLRAVIEIDLRSLPGRRPPRRGAIPGDLSVQPRRPVDQAHTD